MRTRRAGWPDDLMARHGDMGFADAMSWILPTDFQIPEFIRGYIGLIDSEVLQSIGIFLIFVMVIDRAQAREKSRRAKVMYAMRSRRSKIKYNDC